MFSSATKIKGQGVGSAYTELIKLLKKYYPKQIELTINKYVSADISHYHTVDLPFYLSTFSKKRGTTVGYVHFLPETVEGSLKLPWLAKKIFYRYLIAFYKRMDNLVVVNPDFISKLTAYGIPQSKITYIPNFVSKTEFYPLKTSKAALRAQFGLQEDTFTVLGVGQIQERKGVFDFIKLAQQNPDMQFVWVGGFSFGAITDGYKELKKVVANPPTNLHFPGIVDRQEMNCYYNLADIFLLPSYNELFPMSILEAFSCRTPVLLRDLDLYRDILVDYYQGAKDCATMEVYLRQYVQNPEALKVLQAKAQTASQHYSEDHLAQIWWDYYTDKGQINDKKK